MPRKKQRSLFQQAQSAQNLVILNSSQKENLCPTTISSVPATFLKVALDQAQKEETRGDDYKRRFNNEHRKDLRSKARIENILSVETSSRAELQDTLHENDCLVECNQLLKKKTDALRKQKECAPAHIAHVVAKTTQATKTHHLHEQGVFSGTTREMVRELVKNGVAVDRVNGVIHAVSESLGLDIPDRISPRSVGRIVLEGGVAAKLQLAHKIANAQSITLSGDGTTHKHINHESKHITLQDRSDAGNLSPGPSTLFAGVSTAENHTSETQFNGWISMVEDILQTYKSSPLGRKTMTGLHDIATKIKGVNTDHAEDQKKLFRLIKDWKKTSDREHRGETVLLSASLTDILPILSEANEEKITEAGGLEAWNSLPIDEQGTRNTKAHRQVCAHLGEQAFAALTPQEQREIDFLIWAGCCMHKEMNSVKGGNTAMMAYWETAGVQGPIKLLNRDNAAAASAGTSAAKQRAINVSQAGGVKTTSLAGAIFNHKDDKKGQQDTMRFFFEAMIGYMISFPDTSNTRYQSHCEAAAVLILHLPLFLEFLELVRDKKESASFNHMEHNVYRALKDVPTVTELCVLVLYAQAVSHPYMREVRGPEQEHKNILDLGPLHDRVKAHCQKIIANPDLLLATDTSYTLGSMDGRLWQRPEAIYAVQRKIPSLPHLRGALVAFFRGALETWERFTAEFASDGAIAQLTTDERKKAFMKTTNDDNEGALGMYRVGARRAPNMTLAQWNARTMYRKNGTHDFCKQALGEDDHKFLRAAARQLDGSGIERNRRQAQAEADQRAVSKKRELDAIKKSKRDKAAARIDAVSPILDLSSLRAIPCKLKVPEIDLQLDWHRRNGHGLKIPMKKLLKRKDDKLKALINAVEAYNSRIVAAVEEDEECIHQSSDNDSDAED